MELALPLTGFAKAGNELAIGGEFLNAVVAPVGDIYSALGVHSYAPGRLNWPPCVPASPHCRMYVPSVVNFWTRWLFWSTMYT